MKNPDLIPEKIKDNLKNISLWETDPNNLFRITWKNEPISKGGGFGNVNFQFQVIDSIGLSDLSDEIHLQIEPVEP